MLLRWIAVFALAGTLVLPAHAEEKDAPLPFDDPSAAQAIAKKKPVKSVNASKHVKAHKQVKAGKKQGVTPATAHQVKPVAQKSGKVAKSKIAPKKSATKKTAAKKPVSKKQVPAKKPVTNKSTAKKTPIKKSVTKKY